MPPVASSFNRDALRTGMIVPDGGRMRRPEEDRVAAMARDADAGYSAAGDTEVARFDGHVGRLFALVSIALALFGTSMFVLVPRQWAAYTAGMAAAERQWHAQCTAVGGPFPALACYPDTPDGYTGEARARYVDAQWQLAASLAGGASSAAVLGALLCAFVAHRQALEIEARERAARIRRSCCLAADALLGLVGVAWALACLLAYHETVGRVIETLRS
jgi:hypothetical protein